MTEDIRKTLWEKTAEIEMLLDTAKLTEEEKNRLRTAMEFGYAAAFCERTSDINEDSCRAENYKNTYEKIRKRLE